MSDAPTPETDAAAVDGIDCYGDPLKPWDYKASKDGEVVPAEFARRLESERDEARRELASMQKALVRLIKRWKRRKREYLNASNDEWDAGDKYVSRRYYGEAIGTHWAIEDLELIAMKLIAKMKKEAK